MCAWRRFAVVTCGHHLEALQRAWWLFPAAVPRLGWLVDESGEQVVVRALMATAE